MAPRVAAYAGGASDAAVRLIVDHEAERQQPAYPISSVDKALRLLLLFRDRQVLRLSDASILLDIAPSTAHRLLAMLNYYGFVQRDPDTRAYVVRPPVLDVGIAASGGDELRRRARPYLETMSAKTGETAHLCVLRGPSLLFIDSVESTRSPRTGTRAGVTLPAHCTSGGKALLAEMPVEVVAQLLGPRPLVGLTPASITTMSALERELTAARQRGYATSRGESETDIAAVGVALSTLPAQPRAAIAIAAPISRLGEADAAVIAAALRPAASALARLLQRGT